MDEELPSEPPGDVPPLLAVVGSAQCPCRRPYWDVDMNCYCGHDWRDHDDRDRCQAPAWS